MGEHRERVDKRMSKEMNRRVLIPLALDLGARYLVNPYMGEYNDEEKTINWGLGHKNHGDKRHRTHVRYEGISYLDGEKNPGPTRQIVTNERVVWSRKQDNRLAQNDETYGTKEMTYDEAIMKSLLIHRSISDKTFLLAGRVRLRGLAVLSVRAQIFMLTLGLRRNSGT